MDSRYDSTQLHNDNPVIREVVIDLKNDYEEKDGISGNGVRRNTQMQESTGTLECKGTNYNFQYFYLKIKIIRSLEL